MPTELYVAAIVFTGIGVMFRIITLKAAGILILLTATISAIQPISQTTATWVAIGIMVILAMNLAAKFTRTVFGKEAEKSFWDNAFTAIGKLLMKTFGRGSRT